MLKKVNKKYLIDQLKEFVDEGDKKRENKTEELKEEEEREGPEWEMFAF